MPGSDILILKYNTNLSVSMFIFICGKNIFGETETIKQTNKEYVKIYRILEININRARLKVTCSNRCLIFKKNY